MKYHKANLVFPPSLLEEIQKYVQGEYVYIPNPKGCRKRWGTRTGSEEDIAQRNEQIRSDHEQGLSIKQLAQNYCLSDDSIKKIVYTNSLKNSPG